MYGIPVKSILLVLIGVGLIITVVSEVWPTLSNHTAANISINMVANDTLYAIPNAPIYTSAPYTPTLTYANGTLVSNYTITSTQVKTGFNIVPGAKFAHYTYYDQPWIQGTNYEWVVVMVILLAAIGAILKVLHFV